MGHPFVIKDCTLIAIATGEVACNLRELHNQLKTIHPGCIYYHFWGEMLHPSFDEPEYQNDFAAWAWRSLHDTHLAEKLALLDPSHYPQIDDLRQALIDIIEERLAESAWVPWARPGQHFKFIRSQIVVFDTGKRIDHPLAMGTQVAGWTLGSVFYHFIDARRRTDSGRCDFVEWLQAIEDERYAELISKIMAIDPYFTNLVELRKELAMAFVHCPEEGVAS